MQFGRLTKNMPAHIHVFRSLKVSHTWLHLILELCSVHQLLRNTNRLESKRLGKRRQRRRRRLTLVPVLFSLSLSRAINRSLPFLRNLAVVGEFGRRYQTSGEIANERQPIKLSKTCQFGGE